MNRTIWEGNLGEWGSRLFRLVIDKQDNYYVLEEKEDWYNTKYWEGNNNEIIHKLAVIEALKLVPNPH